MSNNLGLLVIDAQEDFFSHPNLSPKRTVLIQSMRALLNWAREEKKPIFHVITIVAHDGSNAMPHWKLRNNFQCRVGSQGAMAPIQLEPLAEERVFQKQFFNAFDDPNLDLSLRAASIDTLVIMGLYTHACIREAALSAYSRGYKVLIPVDCIASYDELHACSTIDWLNVRAATCTSSDLIIHGFIKDTVTKCLAHKEIHYDPCDSERVLFEVSDEINNQIELKAQSITQAQSLWVKTSLDERKVRLHQLLQHLIEQKPLLIEAIVRDLGKPYLDAVGEVEYGLNLLDNICAQLIDREVFEGRQVHYHPHGVVALITPWNNPFAIPISKIAAAIGFGNGVIWKPAIPATRISEFLMHSLKVAGLNHLVGLVTGGAKVGHLVASSRYTKAISFTGSVATGRKISHTAKLQNKPLQAELGGNNAAIVLSDADLEFAAQDLATAMFSFSGQRCTAIRRVIIEEIVFDRFCQLFSKAITALRIGDPSSTETQLGPVISKAHHQFLLNAINQEIQVGTKLLVSSEIPKNIASNGNWIAPTVFINPDLDSKVWNSELFGPVAALCSCKDFDYALHLHNEVEQGLLGVIYTNDPLHQEQFTKNAKAGILSINKARPSFSAAGPFIGWKSSGIGVPEHGRWNREFYTQVQAIYK
ncbi:aldehyde dehydrogenase family protein [Polynucleobacter paneuropaeus]|nr:aldehyde dehydrogenase family protein [Polynucleobacter paneuropaeus]